MTRHRIVMPMGLLAALCLLSAVSSAAQGVDLDPGAPYTSNPDVAPAAGGQFVVTWARDRRIPLSFGPDVFVPNGVVGQRRNDDAQPAGSRFIVLTAGTGGTVGAPQIATTPAGAQFVWTRSLDDVFVIEGRALKNGRWRSRETLAGCADGRLRSLRLIPSPPGALVLWNEICGGSRILVLRLDAVGRPVGDARVLIPASASPGAQLDAAPFGADGFVLSWVQKVDDGYGGVKRLVARVFRGDGKPKSSLFPVSPETVEPNPSRPVVRPAVTATLAGSLLIAWPRPSDGRLVVRQFRADGTPQGPEREVGDEPAAIEGGPTWAVGDPAARGILVWQRFDVPPQADCLARAVGAQGPQGSEFVVAPHCVNAAAAISGDRLLVAWQEPRPEPADNGTPYRAMARSLRLVELR